LKRAKVKHGPRECALDHVFQRLELGVNAGAELRELGLAALLGGLGLCISDAELVGERLANVLAMRASEATRAILYAADELKFGPLGEAGGAAIGREVVVLAGFEGEGVTEPVQAEADTVEQPGEVDAAVGVGTGRAGFSSGATGDGRAVIPTLGGLPATEHAFGFEEVKSFTDLLSPEVELLSQPLLLHPLLLRQCAHHRHCQPSRRLRIFRSLPSRIRRHLSSVHRRRQHPH
jgi:hypothetical protein